MIRLTTPLWRWGEGKGAWYFLTLDGEAAAELRLAALAEAMPRRGFGAVRVEACIAAAGETPVRWRTSAFPQRDGGYLLPLKASIRTAAGLAVGDAVTVSLSPV